MPDLSRITALVEPETQALGFDLVRIRWFGGSEVGDEEHTLQIMAENPATGQLILDECAALSHRISDRIDAMEEQGFIIIAEPYRLEVSSPGIDRPLVRLKDFAGWAGHEAKVTLTEAVEGNRKMLHGEVAGVEGHQVLFDDRKSGRLTLPFANIQSAKLVLTDRLIAATRPLDTTGADHLEETDYPEFGPAEASDQLEEVQED